MKRNLKCREAPYCVDVYMRGSTRQFQDMSRAQGTNRVVVLLQGAISGGVFEFP